MDGSTDFQGKKWADYAKGFGNPAVLNVKQKIVIQRRMDGSTDFQGKKWADNAKGFGNPASEYWLGNDAIHALTKTGNQKLRIDVARFSGVSGNATYSTFIVNNAANKYKLTVGGYKGSSGFKDNLSYHNGMYFSTTDTDNDKYGDPC
ncbi:ryncolin-4-like, partial [Saccostrea cucullata]|uniref:ryncolin-4-like n=1 Tax=Saccostrea cuccullata TaxID=36930 RepID=UPI002ED042B4